MPACYPVILRTARTLFRMGNSQEPSPASLGSIGIEPMPLAVHWQSCGAR